MRRNLVALVCFFSFCAFTFGQEKDTLYAGQQEIKINLAMTILGVPEITYEYFLESNSSVGLSVAVGLEKPENLALRFIATPHYRLFFGKKKNAGFFIEANAAVASYSDYYRYTRFVDNNGDSQVVVKEYEEKTTNFGLGAALGFKLLTKSNYVGELYAGLGRLFGDSLGYEVYPRIGLSIGKRF